jgi:maltose O-acetyltransferase
MRRMSLLAYYLLARYLPTQPMPGWRMAYAIRRWLVGQIIPECGPGVTVRSNCYFGNGDGLRVGANADLGQNARIDHEVTIGRDVVMGPDVVVMTISHAFDDCTVPIRLQGALPRRPVVIGDGAWIGTRVIVMPGVTIGAGSVIGAGSIVTRDIPENAIAVGNPCRVIRQRGEVPVAH